MKLTEIINEKLKSNIEVIEVYPHATEITLRKGDGQLLKELAKRAQIKNEHEYDAILCAITAKFYYDYEVKYRAFGKVDTIIVPVITQYPMDFE